MSRTGRWVRVRERTFVDVRKVIAEAGDGLEDGLSMIVFISPNVHASTG